MKHVTLLFLMFAFFFSVGINSLNASSEKITVVENIDPSVTIVYPLEGDILTIDDIVFSFQVKGVPLDGSYVLNVECIFVDEVTGFEKQMSESGFGQNLIGNEAYWCIPIVSEEISVPVLFLKSHKYWVSAYIQENGNTGSEILANKLNQFEVKLPFFDVMAIDFTPSSGTVDEEKLEIEIQVIEEVIGTSEVQIFYYLSDSRFGVEEYIRYEDKIILEGYGNYFLNCLVKIKGYEAFEQSAEYFIDDSEHLPSLTLISPEVENVLRDGNVLFNFLVEDAIWSGAYKVFLSIIPLQTVASDFSLDEGEIFELPVRSTFVNITKYLPNGKYKIKAYLGKDVEKPIVEIDPFELIVEELYLYREDIIVTPEPIVTNEPIQVTIALREGLPDIYGRDVQYAHYQICIYEDYCTQLKTYRKSIVLDNIGEYYIKFNIQLKEYMPFQTVLGPYIIQKGGSDISEISNIKWYIEDNVLYLPVSFGGLVEVFTLQGVKVYSSYTSSDEIVAITGLPENQLLLVKVNDKVLKITLK